MRRAAVVILSLLLLGPGWLGENGRAQEERPTEYQVKAAFLFNFAKFVQWPARVIPADHSPIIIGVLGDNPFHGDLTRTIEKKMVDDHPLEMRELHSLAEAAGCHILFISASEAPRLAEILRGLQGKSVLTVGDMDRFADGGGMIQFVLRDSRVRFQINNQAAVQAGLKISAKLLALAVRE